MAIIRTPWASCLLLSSLLVCPVMTGCNQSSGFVMNESGKSLYAQGQYTPARREFERAMLDSPENPDYAFNVAAAMRKQGDLIGAERMYRHGLNLDPRHQPSHHGLADMLVSQGRVAEADSHLQEWTATQPYLAEAHIENAWFRRQQGDAAGAEQSLRKALEVDPKNSIALAQLGEVYESNGRPDEARAMYQRSLARNPFQSEVKARMAATMQRRPQWPGSQMAGYQQQQQQLAAYPMSGPMAGGQMAAYPPAGQMAASPYNPQMQLHPMQAQQWQAPQANYPMPAQQASYATPAYGPQGYAQQMSMPNGQFNGFASSPAPQPTTTYYGQQASYNTTAPQQFGMPPQGAMPPQGHPGMTYVQAASGTMGPMPTGMSYPVSNGDPAHVPMTMTSVPVVSPF